MNQTITSPTTDTATAAATADQVPDGTRHPLKVLPVTWASLGQFAGVWAVLATIWTLAGLAAVNWLTPSALGEEEIDINEWFAARRTPGRTDLANLGSVPSDTVSILAMMAVLLVVLPLVWRRWHGWAFLVGALGMEAAVYQTSNMIVQRPRPPVDQLEQVINNSFPSGHMAAAVSFYVGLVVLVWWRTSNPVVRAAAVVLGTVFPLIVATSRLYLGVHYVTDLLAGAVLGLTSVTVSYLILRRGLARTVEQTEEPLPPHTTRLDLSGPETMATR